MSSDVRVDSCRVVLWVGVVCVDRVGAHQMTREEAVSRDERDRWFNHERDDLVDDLVRRVATRLRLTRCFDELEVLARMSPDERALVACGESHAIHMQYPCCASSGSHRGSGTIGLAKEEAA